MRSGMEIKRSTSLGGLLLAVLAVVMLMVSMTKSATATRVELRRRSMSKSSSTEFIRSVAQKSRVRYQNVVRPLVMAAADPEEEEEEEALGTRVTADMFNDVGMLSLNEYLMDISIGTPPVTMQAVVDTGSDLLWAKCDPCNGVSCNSAQHKHKHSSSSSSSSRYVNPASSSTYTPTRCSDRLCRVLKAQGLSNCTGTGTGTDSDSEDCNFLYAYGDGTYLLGNVAYDTVTLGGVSVPHIAFGCAHNVSISGGIDLAGIVGLGGGAISLPSQLRYPHFSYCLSSDPAATSTLRFGSTPATGAGAGVARILRNPISDTFYFLDVRDVAVQGRSVGIPPGAFDIKDNGAGGMLIDSGTPVTFLAQNVYTRVAAAVHNAVTALPKAAPASQDGLQICYSYAHSSLSSMVMKFPEGLPDLGLIFGDHGAVWTVGAKNAFVYDESSRLACLGAVESNQLSLLGSYWQHDLVLDYNLRDRILSFQAAQCHML